MKKKFFALMLFFAVLGVGVYTYAGDDVWDGSTVSEPQKNSDGAYVITNGAELAWVATESNKAVCTFNIIIDNDIDLGNKQWTPIGQKQYFNGSIEGNGHTVKGLFMAPDATATCVGLVGKTNSASSYIKNLSIEGVINVAEVYTSSQCDIGSLIGLANAMGTVDNCHSKVNISVSANGKAANYMGGLIGRAKAMKLLRSSYGGVLSIGNDVTFNKGWGGVVGTFNSTVEGATTTMDNCWFDGKVNNTAAKAPSYGAALVGFPALTKGSFSMHNCYAAGTFNTNSDKGIVFTTFNTPTMNVGNNYAVDYSIEDANAIHLTKEQGVSGELCWRLNGDQTKRVFGQDLSADVLPSLIEDSKAVNRILFMVDAEEFDSLYVNDAVVLPAVNPSKEEHTFVGWFDAETEGNEVKAGSTIEKDMTLYARFTENPKDIWDGVTLTAIIPDETGVYHVTTGAELAWVASESNKDIITWNIVLDNSIYLGNHAWTPIGQDKAFNGVFDGQGYTINDLYIEATKDKTYWGLFGNTSTSSGNPAAIIKNVNLNGNMNIVSGSTSNNIGTLIGYSNNGVPQFTNCHSSVNISMNVAKGANYLGGLIGLMKAGHFTSCSYSGTMTFGADATFNNGWGGLVGSFNSGTTGLEGSIKDCWFDGEIKSAATATTKYGAYLCGYPRLYGDGATVTITGNYINGIIEITGATPTNFGNILGKSEGTIIASNNYGVGITGDDNVITADETQLHNGELCWRLNGDQTQIAFGQTLKDAESVPVVATDDNRVFKVTFVVEGDEYEVAYTNGKVVLPKTDPTKGTETFTGWFDAITDGNQYTADSTIEGDMTLYAHFYNKESDGKIRILAIGNSFTVDAVEDYLAPIVHSTGKDVIIGYPYKGGTTLEQHMGYINTNNAIYNYRKIEAGKDTYVSKGTTVMKTAIVDEPWDYVIIQTDHNYSGVYSHYFPHLTDLMGYVKANLTNPTAKFMLYMTWAYDEGSSYNAFSLYNNDQMTMYNAIVDCAYRAAEAAGIETVIPTGTAIQNCRSTYIGQKMNRDGYHLNYTYGRYVAGLSWAKAIMGIDPETLTYHPTTISDNMAKLCQQAVNIAFKSPKAPTSMAEEWGVDPDIKNVPLARPIFISFDSKRGQECAGTYWNVLQSADATAQIERMVDNRFVKTGVKVAVVEPMKAGYVDGPMVTETEWQMPAAVSSTAFVGTNVAKMSITGLRAGQAYDFGVFGSYAATEVNMETKYVFTGVSADSVALDVANNTKNVAWVKDVVADKQGRVTLTIKAGDNNTDSKKTVAINALEINPHLTAPGDVPVYINLTNSANVAEDNWNNITENAVDAGVDNMINAYKKSTGFGVKITKAFAGVNENGATSTTAVFPMPAEASKTAYWVNGVKKSDVLVDEAELEINGLDPTKMYNFCFFASQTDNTEVYEAEYTAIGENNRFVTLNANGNTANTSWINDIQPTQEGKIRITITPGPSSVDTYRVGFLNTIMMTYADTVQINPEEDIPTRPEMPDVWDGKMVVEPLQGANDWYIITNGAELAWISQIASSTTFAGNVVFTKDIDLGNHKWTPIGNTTQYFNGCIEGNGHSIKGLYLEPAKGDLCSGLVGATNSTGYIRNLNLEGKILFVGSPTGSNQDVGSFVGLANALSLLENCHSTMDIDGTNGIGLYTGGLLGRAKAVNVNKCSYSGNMIAGKNNSKGGWGGLVGTFNSSVVDAKGGITNSWFDGTITCSSQGAFVYGSALCGYANLNKGMCTIKNNYINGSVTITGVTPTNYNVVCGKAVATTTIADIYGVNITSTNVTTVTETQLHNGELSRKLNYGVPVGTFGQDLSNPTSHPVVFADSIVVLKTDYVISADDTTVVYNNHNLIFPAEPVVDGSKFLGWFDAAEGGNQYQDGDSTDTDLIAYAHFELVTGIEEVKSQSTVNGQQSTAVYNLQGQRVESLELRAESSGFRGIVIRNGKKYIKK